MDFLRNLFGKKHKTSSPSSSELNKNAKRTKSTKVKSVSAANIHELADHSRQDTKKLIDALGFEEPEAVKLASVVGEIRKWYWNRARSYSGRFGGVCDDCSSPLKHDEFYLTGSNSAICETCLDQHLFVHMEWGPALQNLQGQIGTTNVRVPQNILAVAADAARYIMDFRSKKIADGSLLKEVENAIGQPLTITTQGGIQEGRSDRSRFCCRAYPDPRELLGAGQPEVFAGSDHKDVQTHETGDHQPQIGFASRSNRQISELGKSDDKQK